LAKVWLVALELADLLAALPTGKVSASVWASVIAQEMGRE